MKKLRSKKVHHLNLAILPRFRGLTCKMVEVMMPHGLSTIGICRVSPPGWRRSNIFPKASEVYPNKNNLQFSQYRFPSWEGLVGCNRHPNLRSINLQIRIPKKNASLPQLQHHVIMLRHHVILLSEVKSQFAEKKQEIAIQKPFPSVRFVMSDFFQMYAFHPDLSYPFCFVRHFPMRKQRHEVT